MTAHPPADVPTLLDRAVAGSGGAQDIAAARRAVDALFAAHHDRVYWLCLRWTGEPERAAELTQDTLLVAYRRLPDVRPERGSFRAWLFGIARNLCRRATVRRRELLDEDGVMDAADPARGRSPGSDGASGTRC